MTALFEESRTGSYDKHIPKPSRVYAIDASTPASSALAAILETLLAGMVENEVGVIERRGSEPLHDYRVAVRRTRTALSLFGGLLDPAVKQRGREFFAGLGRATSPARDLDVLKLALSGYVEDLARSYSSGIERLEQKLHREAQKQHAAVRRMLEDEDYDQAMTIWRSDLRDLAQTRSEQLFGRRAAEAIAEAGGRAFRQVDRLGQQDPDAAIHRLRIRCKKLRYALEFSRALVSGSYVEEFVAALEAVQDELGAYQDLVVHRKWILGFCQGDESPSVLEDLGERLDDELRLSQSALRASIEGGAVELEESAQSRLDALLGAFVK